MKFIQHFTIPLWLCQFILANLRQAQYASKIQEAPQAGPDLLCLELSPMGWTRLFVSGIMRDEIRSHGATLNQIALTHTVSSVFFLLFPKWVQNEDLKAQSVVQCLSTCICWRALGRDSILILRGYVWAGINIFGILAMLCSGTLGFMSSSLFSLLRLEKSIYEAHQWLIRVHLTTVLWSVWLLREQLSNLL